MEIVGRRYPARGNPDRLSLVPKQIAYDGRETLELSPATFRLREWLQTGGLRTDPKLRQYDRMRNRPRRGGTYNGTGKRMVTGPTIDKRPKAASEIEDMLRHYPPDPA